MKTRSTLVIFTTQAPRKSLGWWQQFDTIIAPEELKYLVEKHKKNFIDLDNLKEQGSIYDATNLLEQLPKLKLSDGSNIYNFLKYKGYELWWIHNNNIFRYFCLPFVQFKCLLEKLKEFERIYFLDSPHKNLFKCYLDAYDKKTFFISHNAFRKRVLPSLGILIQVFLTTGFFVALLFKRLPILIYTGDKFEKGKDYDFRMKFVYEELRKRKLLFVEFIRGIEPWSDVLSHAWKRCRPTIYSEAIIFISGFLTVFSRNKIKNEIIKNRKYYKINHSSEDRFKFDLATQYLYDGERDVWAIRIMKFIVRTIGIKAAFIPAASERTWHTLIACRLNNIPIVGIMHGVHSRHYNTYDFLTGFKGERHIGVDKYGLWSEWWRKYYLENSQVYEPSNLYVSGPMRPLFMKQEGGERDISSNNKIRTLFLSEEVAIPEEVLPYLYELLKHEDLEVVLKFRPSKDGFKNWINKNRPEILKLDNLHISKDNMQEAIKRADVAVGCQSTGVLEVLFNLKVPIYFFTDKWGDYYNLKEYKESQFFARDPSELVQKIYESKGVPKKELKILQNRFFGDSTRNGSKWVVDELEKYIKKKG